jgi:RNA-directed DNA polymerase
MNMMSKGCKRNGPPIPIERCHLFGIRSPHALANRLGWDSNKLDRLAVHGGYRVYPHKQTGRMIQEPGPALQSLHRQIHRYLSRVEVPAYLHSGVKVRSYVSNAKTHVGAGALFKIDIAKFYQSVAQHKVMHFFRDGLHCAEDVAGLLANLICFNGRLATGSAASPIISYYTYKGLFDNLKSLADHHGLVMTCYVDDITMSGTAASPAVLHEARKLVFRAGLRAHKDRHFRVGEPKLLTGVIVGESDIGLPFSRWQKIQRAVREVERCPESIERLEKYPILISRLYEAAQIDPRCLVQAHFHHENWRALRRAVRASAPSMTSLQAASA